MKRVSVIQIFFFVFLRGEILNNSNVAAFPSRQIITPSQTKSLAFLACKYPKPSEKYMTHPTQKSDNFTNDKIDATTRAIRVVLDVMRDSALIDKKHAEHCASPSVTHLFKDTPLVRMPDRLKLRFVNSWAGRILAAVMAEEQNYLGDWKITKILEAAGAYDETKIADQITRDIESTPVVVYSFEDCPWCIATKELLKSDPYDAITSKIIELEACGSSGKHIRAELAKMTGRTSMPCIFIKGKPIGGFTDGDPCGPGLQQLHESGTLISLLKSD